MKQLNSSRGSLLIASCVAADDWFRHFPVVGGFYFEL